MIHPSGGRSTDRPTPLWSADDRLASPVCSVNTFNISIFQRHTTPYIYFFNADMQAGNRFFTFFIMVVNDQLFYGIS